MTKKYDVFSSKCPSRNLLNDVTRRWSILVLAALRESSGGAAHFSQIRHRVDGISDRMLSYTLNLLVKDRLITTKSCSEGRGSLYALTDAGRTIAAKSEEMFQSLYAALDQLVDADAETAANANAGNVATKESCPIGFGSSADSSQSHC